MTGWQVLSDCLRLLPVTKQRTILLAQGERCLDLLVGLEVSDGNGHTACKLLEGASKFKSAAFLYEEYQEPESAAHNILAHMKMLVAYPDWVSKNVCCPPEESAAAVELLSRLQPLLSPSLAQCYMFEAEILGSRPLHSDLKDW